MIYFILEFTMASRLEQKLNQPIKNPSTAGENQGDGIVVIETPISEKLAYTIADTGPNDGLAAEDVYSPSTGDSPLSGAKAAAQQAVDAAAAHEARIQEAIKIINTPLESRASKHLEALEAAKNKKTSNPLASLKDKASGAKGALDKIKGAASQVKSAVSEAKKRADEVKKKVQTLKDQKDRLQAIFNDKALLANTVNDTILKELDKSGWMDLEKSRFIQASVNKTLTTLYNVDYSSAKGIVRSMAELSGDRDFIKLVDTYGKKMVHGEFYKKAIEMGIPEYIDRVLDKSDPNDPSTILALERILMMGASKGDVKALNIAVDKLGVDRVNSILPNLIELFIRHYRFTVQPAVDQYPQIRQQQITFFRRLQPNWPKVKRGSETIGDLTTFSRASKDFKTLYAADSEFRIPLLIASKYPRMTLPAIAKRHFPSVAV